MPQRAVGPNYRNIISYSQYVVLYTRMPECSLATLGRTERNRYAKARDKALLEKREVKLLVQSSEEMLRRMKVVGRAARCNLQKKVQVVGRPGANSPTFTDTDEARLCPVMTSSGERQCRIYYARNGDVTVTPVCRWQ